MGRAGDLRVCNGSHHWNRGARSGSARRIANRCRSSWLGNVVDRPGVIAAANNRGASKRILGSACDKSRKRGSAGVWSLHRGNVGPHCDLHRRIGRAVCGAGISVAPRSWRIALRSRWSSARWLDVFSVGTFLWIHFIERFAGISRDILFLVAGVDCDSLDRTRAVEFKCRHAVRCRSSAQARRLHQRRTRFLEHCLFHLYDCWFSGRGRCGSIDGSRAGRQSRSIRNSVARRAQRVGCHRAGAQHRSPCSRADRTHFNRRDQEPCVDARRSDQATRRRITARLADDLDRTQRRHGQRDRRAIR